MVLRSGVSATPFASEGRSLDSASLSAVDVQFVADHSEGFSYVQDIQGGTDYTGKPVVMKLYTLKSISIAGIEFTDVNIIAFDFFLVVCKIEGQNT